MLDALANKYRRCLDAAPVGAMLGPSGTMTSRKMPDRPSFIDLTAPEERAFLIGLDDPADGRWPIERSLAELAALAETAGAVVVGSASQRRQAPGSRAPTSERGVPRSWWTSAPRSASTS